jgi:uncharacterized metal-binding protein
MPVRITAQETKMVDLPKKKVGIVACSGEELAEGTVTRLAALKVLEQLRPTDTVTICLPLFLAGGEGDRAFARFYPTIALDGCEQRCAARATERYSSKPAASLMVKELVTENGINQPQGRKKLDKAGMQAVDLTAQYMAELVDEILEKRWNRRSGEFIGLDTIQATQTTGEGTEKVATCSCGSGIPVQKVNIEGKVITLVGLPLIFQQFRETGKTLDDATLHEMMETVKIYNPIPVETEPAYSEAILREYRVFCGKETVR